MKNSEFRVIDKPIYFSSIEDAQEYAKTHPGESVKRCEKDTDASDKDEYLTPEKILAYLNRFIISQDKAKKEVAIAMYYHSLRSRYTNTKEIQSNGPVMVVGPTGSGKTFIVQKACEIIDTLYIHVDTSSMVSEGIIGYSIGNVVVDILKKADFNIKRAENCVVFFDEMDKLFKNDDSEYGEEVAHQLLRFVEGTEAYAYSKDLGKDKDMKLSTHNMQFILGGAFQWIIDEKSRKKNESFGFISKQNTQESEINITMQDLYDEDIPKELLGRMHTIINIHKLSEDDFYKILTRSESSPLNEFISKIEFHGDSVDISDATIRAVAHASAQNDLGARGLKQILKAMFSDALFQAPNPGRKRHTIVYKELTQ